MERLTIPDKKIDGGVRRTVIDARKVKENAMTIYWALKKYEDTGLAPEKILELKEQDDAKAPVQFGDEDEPMLRCPYCDENVTDLMECGFNFCPYCGKRWYGE